MDINAITYKIALDNVSDPIIITDPEGVAIYSNNALSEITGYSKEEIVGKKAGVLWGKQMPDEFYKGLWHTIKHKRGVFRGIMTNKKKDGTIYNAEVQISPIINQFNEIIYFVGTEKDVSERVNEDRYRNEFMSIVSHQMRTPLTAIKWNIELLETHEIDNLSASTIEIIRDISESNDKLINIVDRFLTLSHLESGKLTISPHKIRIRDFITFALKEERIRATKKRINTVLTVQEGLDVVFLDSKMVGEALANLYSNAIKYTPDGGNVEIDVTSSREGLKFSVKDSGFGIPEEDKNMVFSKFFRSNNIKKYSIEGTGVGLYVAKMIIDSCNGKIDFESEIDKGTTVWFIVPQVPQGSTESSTGITPS